MGQKCVNRNFPDCLELSRLSGNFLDCLGTFHPHPPETFQSVWKLSRLSNNFPDCVETFKTLWKLSKLSENFPNCPKYFQTVWKPSKLMLCFELISSQFCRYAQKLSGRQCRHANGVFLTLPPCRPTKKRHSIPMDASFPLCAINAERNLLDHTQSHQKVRKKKYMCNFYRLGA